MKFKILQKSKVIAETIEFIFEHQGVKYIGRIHDDGNGNSYWLLDENYNEIKSGAVYDIFSETAFDQWKFLKENEVFDTEED